MESLALKQLVLHGSGRQHELRTLFEREYFVLAQLAHPSVIQVHDFGIDRAGPYYTMELVDSGDLSSRAPWPFREACRLIGQVCSALSLLHARRLLHRDISPRNVRCTPQGAAKLIDFGAMVPMGPCSQVIGTPGFIAPEVVHQLPLDARTDLFSLGATLYYALTGRRPFAARTLSELNEAWRLELLPPSQFAPGIPPALDALALALLCIDPAGRPRSAFEVMQRLGAICDRNFAEPEHIAHAYLSKPALVGRDAQQRRFRQRLSKALHGAGGALIFEAEAGMGRSRFLDACAIEAKLAGATVVRVNGRAAFATPLVAAYGIAEQVLEELPDLAASCAYDLNLAHKLFVGADVAEAANANQRTRLRSLEELSSDRYEVRTNLSRWLRAVSERQPIVIAVDDLERVDQASIAWLASVAHDVSALRILIVATLQSSADTTSHASLRVLCSLAAKMPLPALSTAQTETLFGSIFSDAPQLALVSHRVHRLAAGNLRESIALAHHMIERRLIRYADGNWVLPSELAVSDLPTSAEAAVRDRIARLAPLSRHLAETQALAFEEPWTRTEYLALVKLEKQSQVERALAELVSEAVLVGNGGTYTLSHLGVRACLIAGLSDAQRRERHRLLADLCVLLRRPILVEVHHRLLAGRVEQGLDRLAGLLDRTLNVGPLFESVSDRRVVAEILDRAQTLATSHRRPAREIQELSRCLVELSVVGDDALYHRHASAWLAQLERDSGLQDYATTGHDLPAAERIQQAMRTTAARYAATPERDRVYASDEALKQLGHFVAMSTVIAAKTSDARLYASLPSKLEPFARLSPLLDALFQTAVAAAEMNCKAQPERARARMREVHARLEQVSQADFRYRDTVSSAVAQAVAVLEVTLGYPTAEDWLQIMERDPRHQLSALYLRRVLCIFDGDSEAAERYRKQAELLAIQTDGYGLIPARLSLELSAHLHAGDLAGVKYVADRTEQLAIQAPGWLALHQFARASFQRLRGDLPAALEGLERALLLAEPSCVDPPPQLNVWVLASAMYVTALVESDRAHEARVFGIAACARCETLGLSGCAALVSALALAEAALGHFAEAAERMDALIATRAHVRPSLLAADYEARARIAIGAKDADAAARFVMLAASQRGPRSHGKHARLLDEAKQAGLELAVSLPGLAAALLGSRGSDVPTPHRVLASIDPIADPSARALRVLELLAEAAGARAGHLYYVQAAGLVRVASLHRSNDAELDRFANEYLHQSLELAAMTEVFTDVNDSTEPQRAIWTARDGAVYRIALLQGSLGQSCVGLVALCETTNLALTADYSSLSTAISSHLLKLGDVCKSDAG
jgi:hypothetical protein